MNNEKTGGPAYPRPASEQHELDPANDGPYKWSPKSQTGMTLLDHFAGLSTAHMADGSGYAKEFVEIHMGKPMPSWKDAEFIAYTAAFNAKMKYADAAAMIAERNRLMNEKP